MSNYRKLYFLSYGKMGINKVEAVNFFRKIAFNSKFSEGNGGSGFRVLKNVVL